MAGNVHVLSSESHEQACASEVGAGNVHVLSSESHEQARAFEVGEAFRIQSLSPTAVQNRNNIISATSLYLSKLYQAGHVTDADVVKFFTKMSVDQIRK